MVLGEEGCLAVCIENPKTKRVGGRIQHVVIRDLSTISWVQWLVGDLPDDVPLFTLSGPVLRRRFQDLVSATGMEGLKFTPAGLRASGATYLYVGGISVNRLRLVGRWRVVSSLEHYVQEAAAVQLLQRLPPVARSAAALVSAFWQYLAFPPHISRGLLPLHGSH